MRAADVFTDMKQRFDADAAAGLDAVFQYEFSDDENHHIVVEGGSCTIAQGDHASPTVTLSCDLATFIGIADGSINGMQAFITGKLKATGNVILAQKMQTLFPK